MRMSPEERADLLHDLQILATDADSLGHDPSRNEIVETFLPLPQHELAVRPEIMVVRGGRGTGKTHLFRVLRTVSAARIGTILREGAGARWIGGFSEDMGHPQTASLDAFGQQAKPDDLRILWIVHLVGCLAAHEPRRPMPPMLEREWKTSLNEPARWTERGHRDLGEALGWLDAFERELDAKRQTVVVLYDHLDRIGLASREIRQRYAGALLALWMSLGNRYRWLRSKIFLREDLFEQAQESFPDASKLDSRSVSLAWDTQALYRMLVRHMARHEGLRGWVARGTRGIALSQHSILGWLPPDRLAESGRGSQKSLVDHLIGERMGVGVKKGYTYRWIPNHLQDANVRVVPRSLLNLVGLAAREALRRGPAAVGDRLLSPLELQAALEETSKRRVKELREEHRVVARLENLQGSTLMLERAEAARRLKKVPDGALDDGLGNDGRAVIAELTRLGVLRERSDGRIDVPDLYRYGYGIKRKGGVRRPR
ncbi:MAG: hypothetical protein AAGF11_28840 [Myxococcota bacterium]